MSSKKVNGRRWRTTRVPLGFSQYKEAIYRIIFRHNRYHKVVFNIQILLEIEREIGLMNKDPGRPGEERPGATRSEHGTWRAAAKRSSHIGTLALLQHHQRDDGDGHQNLYYQ